MTAILGLEKEENIGSLCWTGRERGRGEGGGERERMNVFQFGI